VRAAYAHICIRETTISSVFRPNAPGTLLTIHPSTHHEAEFHFSPINYFQTLTAMKVSCICTFFVLLSYTTITAAVKSEPFALRATVADQRELQSGSVGTVTTFRLVNANAGNQGQSLVDPLVNGAVINLANFRSNQLLSVDALISNMTGPIGSVQFTFAGRSIFRTESEAPYALCGNNGAIFSSCSQLVVGSHILGATPFSLPGRTGVKGTQVSVSFNIIDIIPPPPNGPVPVVPTPVSAPIPPVTLPTAPVPVVQTPVAAPTSPVTLPTAPVPIAPTPVAIPTPPVTLAPVPVVPTPVAVPIPPVTLPTAPVPVVQTPVAVPTPPVTLPTLPVPVAPTPMAVPTPPVTLPTVPVPVAPTPVAVPPVTLSTAPIPAVPTPVAAPPSPITLPTAPAPVVPTPVAAPVVVPTATGQWIEVNPNAPLTARHEACFVIVGLKAYLIAGRGRSAVNIYNPISRSWTNGATPPIQIHHTQCVVADNKIWIVSSWTGGYPKERDTGSIYVSLIIMC
jgi:hypothetical protein